MPRGTSIFDGLRLVACILSLRLLIIPKTKIWAYLSRLRGQELPTVPHLLTNTTIRWFSRWLSLHQFRAVTTSAVDKQELLLSCPELVETGAKCENVHTPHFQAVYLTRFPQSTHTIFYVHGGGFVSGSPDSVSPYLLQLCIELCTRGLVADILAVKYDLAPEHPYPQALRQVVAAYEYALTQSNPIVLLGDSAGGNLCLALLQHLDKPHPMISSSYAWPPGDRGIVATCLTSPWVDLRNESESYRKDAGMDCLDKSALDSWRDAYLGSHPLDNYVCPVDRKVGWKDILPPNTLLMSGDLDLFSADIRRLARNIELDGYQALDVDIAPLKGHVWNVVDFGGTKPAQESPEVKNEALVGVRFQADWIVMHCQV